MDSVPNVMPEPVRPRRVEVDDLGAVSAALNLAPPPSGAATMEVELLPGRFATLVEVEGSPVRLSMCAPLTSPPRAGI